MGIDLLLMLLGIPVSWVGDATLDKLKSLKPPPGGTPLLALFLKSFHKSLDQHGRSTYKAGVAKLKKSIKDNPDAFIQCFTGLSGPEIITQLKNQTFQKKLTAQILETFPLEEEEEHFTPVMEIIIQDSLKNWRMVFLSQMPEKLGIQLNFMLQELSLEAIRDGLDELKELKELKDQLSTIIQYIQKEEQKTKKKKTASREKTQKRQVKVLSLTAAPTGIDGINYEKEQDILLDAFGGFDHEDLHLDMPDPAGSTLDELTLYLGDGRHDILHITAHGGIDHQGRTVLHLEDSRGKDAPTGAKELLDAFPPYRKPKIIILSACHSARPEPHLVSMAEGLFKKGIKVVIGMQREAFGACPLFGSLTERGKKRCGRQRQTEGRDAIYRVRKHCAVR